MFAAKFNQCSWSYDKAAMRMFCQKKREMRERERERETEREREKVQHRIV